MHLDAVLLTRLALVGGLALLVSNASAASSLRSRGAYIGVAGHLVEARVNCSFDVDLSRLRAIGRPFEAGYAGSRLAPGALETELRVARELAGERRVKAGADKFCRDMLTAYGPSGTTASDLLRPRPKG